MIKKVLNLYAGIGGNRALWPNDLEIVAIEHEPAIAKFYQQRFPKDTVIVCDAHQYLLENYMNFDFIWASPPCPTHSDIRRMGVHSGQYKALYPEMELYQEIILLTHFAKLETKWVVENVKPYYNLLIPAKEIGRHLFWANFSIPYADLNDSRIRHNSITPNSEVYTVKLPKGFPEARKVLRNQVNPELGLHIFNTAAGIRSVKAEQINLFPEKI